MQLNLCEMGITKRQISLLVGRKMTEGQNLFIPEEPN